MIHLICPSALAFIKIWFVPQIVLGFILAVMDFSALYNYYHCDFLQFIENRDDLEKYKCYEDTYEPKYLTIVESTPTSISIRNCSDQELAMDFYIRRTVEKLFLECLFTKDFEVYFRFKYDGVIPPGSVLNIKTVEHKGPFNNNEISFTMTKMRSFGPNAGEKVITTISIPGSKDAFHVRMEELYETQEGRTKREKEEAVAAQNVITRRPVRVEKEIISTTQGVV